MRYSTRLTVLAPTLALSLALAGCDNASDSEMPMATEDMPMAADEMPMNGENMPMMQSGAVRTGSAEGTVTAIDAAAGTVTLDHGPVPAMEWPSMTMAFEATPEIRDKVVVGDTVIFEFEASHAGNQITSISKQ